MDAGTIAIIVAVIGSSGAGVVVSRVLPAKATPLELLQEVQEERDRDRDERDRDRARMDQLDRRLDLMSDYVHDLRQHIAEGKPPPPPAWPTGLRM